MQLRSKNPAASYSIWLKTLALISFTILSFLFSSCSDNTVSPPKPPPNPPVDTLDSLFTWQFLNIPGYYFEDVYVYDTNNIYLAIPTGVITVHGNSYFPSYVSDTDFVVNVIDGYDNHNIFLGGASFWHFNSRLMEWDGNNFLEIQLPIDSSVGVENVLVRTPQDVWIGVGRDKIYHYDGLTVTAYNLSRRVLGPTFFADSVGNLYLFGPNPSGSGTGIFYTYQFNGAEWQMIMSNPYDTSTNLYDVVNICGSAAIRSAKDGVYGFIGSNWDLIAGYTNMHIQSIGGKSRNAFFISGGQLTPFDLYYCDGKALYKQLNYHAPIYEPLYGMKNKENNYYGFNRPDDPFDSHLVVGRKKK
jgi:hypothetical protein